MAGLWIGRRRARPEAVGDDPPVPEGEARFRVVVYVRNGQRVRRYAGPSGAIAREKFLSATGTEARRVELWDGEVLRDYWPRG